MNEFVSNAINRYKTLYNEEPKIKECQPFIDILRKLNYKKYLVFQDDGAICQLNDNEFSLHYFVKEKDWEDGDEKYELLVSKDINGTMYVLSGQVEDALSLINELRAKQIDAELNGC